MWDLYYAAKDILSSCELHSIHTMCWLSHHLIATRFPQRLMHRFHFVKIVENHNNISKMPKRRWMQIFYARNGFFLLPFTLCFFFPLSYSLCYRSHFILFGLHFWSSQFSVYMKHWCRKWHIYKQAAFKWKRQPPSQLRNAFNSQYT